jgi:hypothetical protein
MVQFDRGFIAPFLWVIVKNQQKGAKTAKAGKTQIQLLQLLYRFYIINNIIYLYFVII